MFSTPVTLYLGLSLWLCSVGAALSGCSDSQDAAPGDSADDIAGDAVQAPDSTADDDLLVPGADTSADGHNPAHDGASTLDADLDAPHSDSDDGTATPPDATGFDADLRPDAIDATSELDGATPDGATPDGATPDGANQDSVKGDTSAPPEPQVGFPSAELAVRILGPEPTVEAQSLGGITILTGILFGDADDMAWENVDTGATGGISVGTYWASGPVELSQGDNHLLVTATHSESGRVATDTITITYNPAFKWDAIPSASPPVIFVGAQTLVLFRAQLGLVNNFDVNTLELWRVDPAGQPTELVVALRDSGNTNQDCDEVQEDGVFSGCATLSPAQAGYELFRVRADVQNTFVGYEAWSPLVRVDAVEKVTEAQCVSIQERLQAAEQAYVEAVEAQGASIAQDLVMASLLEDPLVAEVGPASDGYGIWIAFEDGLLGALALSPDGLRAGGLESATSAAGAPVLHVSSNEASVLAPFAAEFGALDEAATIRDALVDVGCPVFNVRYRPDSLADLQSFRNLNESALIAITSHGDAYFRELSAERRAAYQWEDTPSQELIWTGEEVVCSRLLQTVPSGCNPHGSPCASGAGECVAGKTNRCVDFKHGDLRRGRLVFGASTYGITPEFFAFHARTRRFPNSAVYLGSCRSLFNGGFAGVFFGFGARAVAGFSDYVTSSFAFGRGVEFFDRLVTQKLTTGESFGLLDDEAPVPMEDPDHPGSEFRLFGAPNLAISPDGGLLNGSFETGDTTGWQVAGDGRVVAQLGCHIPVDGKFMGLLSTGLGFTQTTGELKQKFCVASNKTQVSLYWKYLSEEFLEYCGSPYQDAFTATIKSGPNQLPMVGVNVDDLCPPNECFGCGSQYVGLVPACVEFDQGGVYNTAWQKVVKGVSLIAGTGAATMTLFATDTGDSVFDTVILVDKIEFE